MRVFAKENRVILFLEVCLIVILVVLSTEVYKLNYKVDALIESIYEFQHINTNDIREQHYWKIRAKLQSIEGLLLDKNPTDEVKIKKEVMK